MVGFFFLGATIDKVVEQRKRFTSEEDQQKKGVSAYFHLRDHIRARERCKSEIASSVTIFYIINRATAEGRMHSLEISGVKSHNVITPSKKKKIRYSDTHTWLIFILRLWLQ